MTEASLDHLSERTKAGKEARARAGYHSGPVPFGYLPPDYPKAPTGAPSTWRPPPVPVRPDPLTFPALVRIGELVAQGWTDADIVEELRESLSHPSRFGAPRFTKETIAAIRRSWFPREFAPGCGHGTIKTPSGELVEGNHQAAWPYKLWQQMEAVKTHHYHRLRQQGQRQPHEFSRIIVCAACRRPLRVTTLGRAGAVYYQDTSLVHKRVCAAGGHLSVKSSTVIKQFEEMLSSVTLPPLWRQIIAQQCSVEGEKDDVTERVLTRRAALEAEQKRIISAFIKGDITEEDLDTQMERIRSELYELPVRPACVGTGAGRNWMLAAVRGHPVGSSPVSAGQAGARAVTSSPTTKTQFDGTGAGKSTHACAARRVNSASRSRPGDVLRDDTQALEASGNRP